MSQLPAPASLMCQISAGPPDCRAMVISSSAACQHAVALVADMADVHAAAFRRRLGAARPARAFRQNSPAHRSATNRPPARLRSSPPAPGSVIRASCSGVGSTSPSPSSCTRTVVAPTKLATLGAMPRFSSTVRYSPRLVQVTGIFHIVLPPQHRRLHRRVERPHRLALAHHLQRDALPQIALRPAIDEQALGRPAQHVDEPRRDRLALGIDRPSSPPAPRPCPSPQSGRRSAPPSRHRAPRRCHHKWSRR